MPELPEVETVVRALRPRVIGKRILGAEAFAHQLFESKTMYQDFGSLIQDDTITSIDRWGKYLLFHLASNRVLIAHMKMTGYFLVEGNKPVLAGIPREGGERYIRLQFQFRDKSKLLFSDIRKFGRFWLIPQSHLDSFFQKRKLAHDALSKLCTEEYLHTQLSRDRSIKTLLLDQTCVAGVGNIYADEILWAAKINPKKKGRSLTEEESQRIFRAMKEILKKGIAAGGASIRDYRRPDGLVGSFQKIRKVYQREGKSCARCKTPIKRIVIAQRSTHYCPKCQN